MPVYKDKGNHSGLKSPKKNQSGQGLRFKQNKPKLTKIKAQLPKFIPQNYANHSLFDTAVIEKELSFCMSYSNYLFFL